MIRGSCLCGAIRYEITGPLSAAIYCHCTQCRKATGSSFATNAAVDAKDFRFVAGEELLSHFESSPGQFRKFCSGCGSPLVKTYANRPEVVRLRLGTLDDDPGIGGRGPDLRRVEGTLGEDPGTDPTEGVAAGAAACVALAGARVSLDRVATVRARLRRDLQPLPGLPGRRIGIEGRVVGQRSLPSSSCPAWS